MDYYIILFLLLALFYFVIIYYYIYFSYKPDTLNNVLGIVSLSFVFFHIFLFLLLMYLQNDLRSFFVPLWLLVLGSPIIIVGILVLISTKLSSLANEKTKEKISKLSDKLEKKFEGWSKSKKDIFRKLSHIILFTFLIIAWSIGLSVVLYFADSSRGMIPEENNMLLVYIRLFIEPNYIIDALFSFGWFY